jgi:4-aminobutyrate aminotransferase
MCAALAATAPIPGPVRVFLTNSGAEAVEGALKLARYATGRPYVISFFGAFHGRSYGAMTLTASKAKYHQGFGPLVPGVLHAPYAFNQVDPVTGARSHDPDETFDFLENTLFRYQVAPSEVAAVFVEPVQGEGRYIDRPPPGAHGCANSATNTGSCSSRTRQSGMAARADGPSSARACAFTLISAKGIASGLPLGAFRARAPLMEKWGAGAHASTYGGSPVPCAAGLATLEVIESEALLANASAQGSFLLDGLRALQREHPKAVTDVRGVGLMIGVEFRSAELAERVQLRAFERGLLVLECGESSIRMSPPLVITREQAQTALRIFGQAVEGAGT